MPKSGMGAGSSSHRPTKKIVCTTNCERGCRRDFYYTRDHIQTLRGKDDSGAIVDRDSVWCTNCGRRVIIRESYV